MNKIWLLVATAMVLSSCTASPWEGKLAEAYKMCPGSYTTEMFLGDNGKTLRLVTKDTKLVRCVLVDYADVSDAALGKMQGTRALDGRQTARWTGFEASWTYHPDDGINLVLEEK